MKERSGTRIQSDPAQMVIGARHGSCGISFYLQILEGLPWAEGRDFCVIQLIELAQWKSGRKLQGDRQTLVQCNDWCDFSVCVCVCVCVYVCVCVCEFCSCIFSFLVVLYLIYSLISPPISFSYHTVFSSSQPVLWVENTLFLKSKLYFY